MARSIVGRAGLLGRMLVYLTFLSPVQSTNQPRFISLQPVPKVEASATAYAFWTFHANQKLGLEPSSQTCDIALLQ